MSVIGCARLGDKECEIRVDSDYLYVTFSLLDLADEAVVENERKIKFFANPLEYKEIDKRKAEIIMRFLQGISERKYPSPQQFEYFGSLDTVAKMALEASCSKSCCPCPLFFSVGCNALLRFSSVEKIAELKIIRNFMSMLSGFFAFDVIAGLVDSAVISRR